MAKRKRRKRRRKHRFLEAIKTFFAWIGVILLAVITFVFTAGRYRLDVKATVAKVAPSAKNAKLTKKARKGKRSAEELLDKLEELGG